MRELEQKIFKIFQSRSQDNPLEHIMQYAMFPAGKLFRPKLALSLAQDLGKISEDHYLLSAAVEAHHAYSLVHDDLPCMDNDDWRRGRPSAHVEFGEWKALLAGDALINLSYELLTEIKHPKALEIISNFSQMMGARGLIFGQFLDLSHEEKDLEQTLRMHELKTGRLIQFSLQSSTLLCAQKVFTPSMARELGKNIGVNFQLLDDALELIDETGLHEEKVNAFLNHPPEKVVSHIHFINQEIDRVVKKRNLRSFSQLYRGYLEKTFEKLKLNEDVILKKTGLDPQSLGKIFS